MENPTCDDRRRLAFQFDRAKVPIDGSRVSGYVTYTERNWHRAVLYYLAVMDCDDELFKAFGKVNAR